MLFLFYFTGWSTMFHLVNNHRKGDIHDYLKIFLKNKAPDCIIYSEDGAEFKTHKELFGQTKFMRELLKSNNCCGQIEIIFPCSKEELGHLMNFICEGKIQTDNKSDSKKVIENLNKILGFPTDYINNFFVAPISDVLDETDNNVEAVPLSSDNEAVEEPITIKQEVKAVAKKNILAEIELNESDSIQRCEMSNFCPVGEY